MINAITERAVGEPTPPPPSPAGAPRFPTTATRGSRDSNPYLQIHRMIHVKGSTGNAVVSSCHPLGVGARRPARARTLPHMDTDASGSPPCARASRRALKNPRFDPTRRAQLQVSDLRWSSEPSYSAPS